MQHSNVPSAAAAAAAAAATPAAKLPPQEGCLAWEASEYVSEKVGQHAQSLPHLMRILKDMQKTLDKSRVAYNQALQDRDDERAKLQEAESRLGAVQRVVQRYAGVQEPVVASDGYTYERTVIQQYLNECKSSETNAYSQQTKEVLTGSLTPNESLKKLVDLLRQVRPTEIAPASKATSIPPYRSTNVNFLEGEAEEKTTAATAAAPTGAKKTFNAADIEATLANKSETAPAAAATSAAAPHKKDQREERTATAPNAHNSGSAASSRATGAAANKNALHPCLRVYGFCNFKDDCSFAKYPYDACLNYIKGKCRFGDGCKELHVNPKESRYNNSNATNNSNGFVKRDGANAGAAPAREDAKEKKAAAEEKKDAAKSAAADKKADAKASAKK